MSMPSDQPADRLRITEDDLASESVERRVEEMAQAQRVALVRVVGDAPPSGGTAGRAILTLTAGGAVGGVVAFAGQKWILDGLLGGLISDNSFLNNVSFTLMLAFCIGAAVSLADVTTNRNWAKLGRVAAVAVPVALGAGLLFGIVAHLVYSAGIDWLNSSTQEWAFAQPVLPTEQEILDYQTVRLHPLRGFAWLLVGVSAGIAAGAAARSWKRVGLAAAGGALGGFIGGFAFDFIATGEGSEWIAQLVGIVLLGTLVGLAMALIEQASKSRWIEIVSGGLAGKQFILYQSEITLGSSPSADITLIKDPTIPPIAAMLRVRGTTCELQTAPGLGGVMVNGVESGYMQLADMDVVSIGSTQIRFRERSGSSNKPGALRN